ncbi:MAG: hypothetical protein DI564_01550 [Rhodanobacter denitrificans]|uniref:Uncharacterized protein n=1 Tax=Rhodanobacter denitrificans TaxID=666685 RepID=A0A2W5KY26_9GAMM|nr:MAG: hypothetical protein DI564_01550 [Rhodanobacter denitrificans]
MYGECKSPRTCCGWAPSCSR